MCLVHCFFANEGGESDEAPPQEVVPIEVRPDMSLDEINILTDNFAEKGLIAEGSYGRFYGATLSNGQKLAIKKLDTDSSAESDTVFADQVNRLCSSTTILERIEQCLEMF